jgi:hypothetical protein
MSLSLKQETSGLIPQKQVQNNMINGAVGGFEFTLLSDSVVFF